MQKLKMIRFFCLLLVMVIGFLTIVTSGGGGGDGGSDTSSDNSDDSTIDPYEIVPSTITTFDHVDDGDICTEDDKPVIRMFSTSTCSHCAWSAEAFEPVVQKYVDQGLIVAHHWELYTGDDFLTSEVEDEIPESEMAIYDTFSPLSYVPAFVFGCTYYRIGTGHEIEDDLEAEAAEFMAVIEELLDSDF
jgi:thiol-disulfide isomerase/thioredoxin